MEFLESCCVGWLRWAWSGYIKFWVSDAISVGTYDVGGADAGLDGCEETWSLARVDGCIDALHGDLVPIY